MTVNLSIPRGLSYTCPHCKEGRPITGATVVGISKIIVQAECGPCRMVMAREFTLTGRSAASSTDAAVVVTVGGAQ